MGERKETIISEIEAVRRDLIDLVSGLDAEALARPTCNEGWSVRDVVAHLVSSEAGLKRLADLAARGEPPAARPGFSLDELNRMRVEERRGKSIEELLAEMAGNRVATLGFLRELPDELLDRTTRMHDGHTATVGEIVGHIGEHDRTHSEDIRKAISG